MKHIAIITDTDSCLPAELAKQHNITQVPIDLHIDGKKYTTGVDIDDQLLFEKVETAKEHPTTSAPSPAAFEAAFKQAIADGAEAIICICVSAQMSATYNSALLAAELFEQDITVVDSDNLSMGQGFIVLLAAEAVAGGASKAEVLELIADVSKRTLTYAVLGSLKYVALSGRLSKVSAGVADTFNIKPILTVQNGKLEMVGRQRTKKRAMEKMLTMLSAAKNGNKVERVAIIHTTELDAARQLQQDVAAALDYEQSFIISDFTPGLSVHTGPGVLGVSILLSSRSQ